MKQDTTLDADLRIILTNAIARLERKIAHLQYTVDRLACDRPNAGRDAIEAANDAAERVASETGVSVRQIMGMSRCREVAHARWRVWADMRTAGLSLPVIAAVWGMDHSTVMHGLRKLEGGK